MRLASLCRRLGLSEVIVVGISIGARSALTLAAFYPKLVRRVILMCPSSAPTDVGGDVAQPVLILATRNDGAVSFEQPKLLQPPCRMRNLSRSIRRLTCSGLARGPDRTAGAIDSFIRS